MNDPKRLVELGGLHGSLLASARADSPSSRARNRAAVAIGLGPIALTTASGAVAEGGTAGGAAGGAGAAGKAAGAIWLKALLGGVVGVTAVAAGTLVADGPTTTSTRTLPAASGLDRSEAQIVAPEVPSSSYASSPGVAGTEGTMPPPLSSEATPRHNGNALAAATASPTARAVKREDSVRQSSPLNRELRSLDEIRSFLARGEPDKALTELERHDRSFNGGSLQAESSLLRIDALLARGEKEKAQALAKELLRRDPSGPHARRLRSILDEHRDSHLPGSIP